jgi:AraC-like DNA-binding protein
MNGEMMSASPEDMRSMYRKNAELTPEFVDLMLKLIPYVNEHQQGEITLHQLGEVGGMDVVTLYQTMTPNLYKSPRDLVRLIRLQKAEAMLRTTDKSIEEISSECGFYTPNYFIGNFFHQYKLTPKEYREENAG